MLFALVCAFNFHFKGGILDEERVNLYNTVADKGSVMRFAFAAVVFGEYSEALFWLILPRALRHWKNKVVSKSPQKAPVSDPASEVNNASMLAMITSKEKSACEQKNVVVSLQSLNLCDLILFTSIVKNSYLFSHKYKELCFKLCTLFILIIKALLQMNFGQLKQMAFEHEELWDMANERITWHEKLEGEQAVQNQIHE